ncbi:hypothetical protein OS493_028900 [Desmophyllum pertusum]|uniref:Uncharacterized protein n=1 Tax=Desmophyllum pertusum TaxID=174260 RepID=A0A9X0CXW3_9CNID|nr:hypothetical protein OS493_028900 [Desmophyllum pertusum]
MCFVISNTVCEVTGAPALHSKESAADHRATAVHHGMNTSSGLRWNTASDRRDSVNMENTNITRRLKRKRNPTIPELKFQRTLVLRPLLEESWQGFWCHCLVLLALCGYGGTARSDPINGTIQKTC